jgi:ferritin
MLSQPIQDGINEQINNELSASYSYLAMAIYSERQNFMGCGRWLRVQSQEEYAHAMRLVDFLLARHAKVVLADLARPKTDYASLLDVFETSFKQEQHVSAQIGALYELAYNEKAYPAVVQLQWFLTEQVEEEKTCRDIVAKLKMVGNDAASILEIDRELGARVPGADKAAE